MRCPLPVVFLLLAARTAAAQPDAPAAAAAPPAPARPFIRQTLATNLFLLTQHDLSGEYERAFGTSGFALGVGALAYLRRDDNVDALPGGHGLVSAQLKLKRYARRDGLRGLALGVTAGMAQVTPYVSESRARRRATVPTLGAVVDYDAFVGRRRRLLIGTGLGARDAFVGDRLGDRRAGLVLLDGRLQFGAGF